LLIGFMQVLPQRDVATQGHKLAAAEAAVLAIFPAGEAIPFEEFEFPTAMGTDVFGSGQR